MNLEQMLERVFATNFQCYFRAHVSHVNTVGRNFVSDHALLGDIYSDLQDQIDELAELLRQIDAFMPNTLDSIIQLGTTADYPSSGDADELLRLTLADQEIMVNEYHDLCDAAEAAGHIEIANYAQDRIKQHQKNCWKLRVTLE